MSGLVRDPFNHAPYVEVQRIQIWAVGRPEFFPPKHVDVVRQPILHQMTCVGGRTVLLENIWLSSRHSFHPRLHYICQNTQINFFCDIFPFVKKNALLRVEFPRRCCRTFVGLLRLMILCEDIIHSRSRIPEKPNDFCRRAPGANTFDNRGSSVVLRTWFQHCDCFEVMMV